MYIFELTCQDYQQENYTAVKREVVKHFMAPDALVATRLNKSDGGKNVPLLRDGWFKDATGEIQIQKMQFEDGKPKGIETILREREVSNLIFNVKVVVKESIAAPGSY